MSQNQQIANYLNKGRKLTPIDALNKFGCFRLAARIADLRNDGMNIKHRKVEKTFYKVFKSPLQATLVIHL